MRKLNIIKCNCEILVFEKEWQSKCDRVDKKCDNLWSASHVWRRTRGGLDSSQPTPAFIIGHICHETHRQVPHFSSDTYFMWHNWHPTHNDTVFICLWMRSDIDQIGVLHRMKWTDSWRSNYMGGILLFTKQLDEGGDVIWFAICNSVITKW